MGQLSEAQPLSCTCKRCLARIQMALDSPEMEEARSLLSELGARLGMQFWIKGAELCDNDERHGEGYVQ